MALGMLAGLAGGAGGGVIGSSTVRLLLDDSQFTKGLSTAQAKTQQSTTAMGKSTSKFGTVAKVALLAAAAAAIKFAADSVQSAQEAEAASAKLANTLKNNAQLSDVTTASWEQQAAALQDLTGMEDEAIISGQALLGQFDLTGQQVQQLIPLIVDLSLKMGISMPAAAKAVGKATEGSAGILSRYGIVLEKDALAADAFGATLEGLRSRVGGFGAEFGKTFEGRLKILAANWDDFKEIVGSFLIDIGTPLLTLFTDVVEVIQPVASVIGDLTAAIASNKDAVSALLFVWHPWLAVLKEGAEAVNRYQQSGSLLDAVYGELNQATRESFPIWTQIVGAQDDAAAANERGASAAQANAREQQALADAHQEAAEAAQEQYAAELALVGGFLGVQGAALSAKESNQAYAEALAEVNRLSERGKQGTQAWRDAVQGLRQAELGAIEGQLGLAQAIADYIGQVGEGKAAQDEAIGLIRDFGRAAGLSDGQINQLVNRVLALVRAYDQIPEKVTTNVHTNYTRSGTPGAGTPSGAGGHQAAQHGLHGYVHQPTWILAGEGNKTERVDISPHVGSPAHRSAMARGGGGGGGVTVKFGTVNIYNDADLEELAGMVAGTVEGVIYQAGMYRGGG